MFSKSRARVTGDEDGGPSDERGAGGKIPRRRRDALAVTPYRRPDEGPSSSQEAAAQKGWLSGLLFGAGRLITSVFRSDSGSSSGSECSSDSECDLCEELSEDECGDDSNIMEAARQIVAVQSPSKFAIEQLLQQETFSREESDRLMDIIQSRIMDSQTERRSKDGMHTPGVLAHRKSQRWSNQNIDTMGKSPNSTSSLNTLYPRSFPDRACTPDLCNAAVMEAKKWVEEKKCTQSSKSDLSSGPCVLNTDLINHYDEGDGGSPVDMAKSYMQSLPPWQSPLIRSIGFKTPPTGSCLEKYEITETIGVHSLSLQKEARKRSYLGVDASDSFDAVRNLRQKTEKLMSVSLITAPEVDSLKTSSSAGQRSYFGDDSLGVFDAVRDLRQKKEREPVSPGTAPEIDFMKTSSAGQNNVENTTLLPGGQSNVHNATSLQPGQSNAENTISLLAGQNNVENTTLVRSGQGNVENTNDDYSSSLQTNGLADETAKFSVVSVEGGELDGHISSFNENSTKPNLMNNGCHTEAGEFAHPGLVLEESPDVTSMRSETLTENKIQGEVLALSGRKLVKENNQTKKWETALLNNGQVCTMAEETVSLGLPSVSHNAGIVEDVLNEEPIAVLSENMDYALSSAATTACVVIPATDFGASAMENVPEAGKMDQTNGPSDTRSYRSKGHIPRGSVGLKRAYKKGVSSSRAGSSAGLEATKHSSSGSHKTHKSTKTSNRSLSASVPPNTSNPSSYDTVEVLAASMGSSVATKLGDGTNLKASKQMPAECQPTSSRGRGKKAVARPRRRSPRVKKEISLQ